MPPALTARSTARCSLARRRCSGTRRLPDSRRSWRTCGDRARWGHVPSPVPPHTPSAPPPALTGFRGSGGDRRRAGSPRGYRRWHPHRTRGHTGHRNPLPCCASIPGGAVRHKLGGDETPQPTPLPKTTQPGALRSRRRSRGGSSRNDRCTRRARSAPGTAPPRCGCNRGHSPAGGGGAGGTKKRVVSAVTPQNTPKRGKGDARCACGGCHLAGEPVVAGGAAAFLHLGGRGEAGLGGHSGVHGHVGDAGRGRAGRVGGSDEELVQVGQSHQQMLPRRRLPIRPLPVLLWAERGCQRWGGHKAAWGTPRTKATRLLLPPEK